MEALEAVDEGVGLLAHLPDVGPEDDALAAIGLGVAGRPPGPPHDHGDEGGERHQRGAQRDHAGAAAAHPVCPATRAASSAVPENRCTRAASMAMAMASPRAKAALAGARMTSTSAVPSRSR